MGGTSQRNQRYFMYRKMRLPHAVTAVNDEIVTSHVGAGIANQVDVGALQLLSLTVAAHGDHRVPQVLDILLDEVRQTSINVSGGDAVDTSKVAPLVGKGASHVNAASLGDVVGGLFLREVGDVAGHGGGDDEAASSALLEVSADGLGAMESTVQIGLDDFGPVIDSAIEDTSTGGAAGVSDEGVDLAEFLNGVVDELLHAFPVADVALVGLDLDAVGLRELLGVLLAALWARGVGDGQVSAHFGTAAGSLNAHTAGS